MKKSNKKSTKKSFFSIKAKNIIYTLLTFEKIFFLIFFCLVIVFGFKIITKFVHKEKVLVEIEMKDKQGVVLEEVNDTFMQELINETRKKRKKALN